jgi:hypothetical protein
MVAVTLARNGIFFLVAWETMSSLCAYALVSWITSAETRRAGWIYLIASHAGTGRAARAFVLLETHSLPSRARSYPARLRARCCTALAGFGVKAGIVPFHVWLRRRTPPSVPRVGAHVRRDGEARLRAALLRVALVLGGVPSAFGLSLAALGLAGALLGIALSRSSAI